MSLEKLCPKVRCEVCEETEKSTLHRHHIVERTDARCTNHPFNLVVLCANCHNMVHAGRVVIKGVWPGNRPPAGRLVVYVKDGVCNFPELENEKPYFVSSTKSMKLWK